jgi:GDP-4-dehydro-6-deoxy-D-mannose reductase
VSIQEVIDLMQGQLGLAVALETDQRLVRPNDNRIVVGSREKIRDAIGWEPEIPLTESLATILDWWRQQ